ncbi:MAG: hypothetical protein DI541_18105 [Aeromonas media]|nr:MAG: hypothetical protein DI541_18105 [Aeromonas media]
MSVSHFFLKKTSRQGLQIQECLKIGHIVCDHGQGGRVRGMVICESPSQAGLGYDSGPELSKDSTQFHYKRIGDV